MKHLIAPSLLAADFGNIQTEVQMLNQSEADWIHIDVMDGVFVPNISFGFPVLSAVQKFTQKLLDVHLMIVQPERYIEQFAQAGAGVITVHYEASTHLHRIIQQIKDCGVKAGVALNPHTAVNQLENVIQDLDLVLLMSVNPGFGGQKFIQNTYQKITDTKDLILRSNSGALIEIDGGVNLQNASGLIGAGADVLVAGSFVFSSPEPIVTIRELKNIQHHLIA